MTEDIRYMRRALELASLGQGETSPNPLVGAVIVHQGRILGEGYHHRSGEPHAEVMAVQAVRERHLLPEATLYVTLEPCAHHGKTPPCADLILRERIPRVRVAMGDPFAQVAGKGLARLREAGVEVEVGLLEEEAKALNRPFLTAQLRQRPWVTLKWAQSLDGYLDGLRGDRSQAPVRFSSPWQQRRVHALRQRYDAILVGFRTALLDDPQLTNRLWYGAHPLRIVLDSQLQLPEDLRLFRDGLAPTWVVHAPSVSPSPDRVCSERVRYLPLSGTALEVSELLKRLTQEGIQSLLVEGGARTLQAFLDAGAYDEVYTEVASFALGEGVRAPRLPRR